MSDLIIPPPTIIKIIETTVVTIAKWGEKLEKRILEDKKDPKFSFLLPDDPFHAYYMAKLEDARRGQREKHVVAPKQILNTLVTQKPRQRPVVPPMFTYQQPPEIGGLQLDVIHLTAQNVALYGQEFLQTVARQEAESPLFGFLLPGRPYFRFFYSLYEQYKLALDPPVALRRRLEQEAVALAVIKDNFDAEAAQERSLIEEKKRQAEEEKQPEDMHDWDDFKVLATVDYKDEPVVNEVDHDAKVAKTLRRPRDIEQVSSITGQRVPVAEFGDHLRFEMQHPQYLKEIETRRERASEQHSALAKGDEMATNLRMFARGESERVENAVIWDGREESVQKVVAEAALSINETSDKSKKQKDPDGAKKKVVGPVFD